MPPPHFLRRKKKEKRGKKTVSNQKLSKGCHQGESVTVLASLERLEFKKSSSHTTKVANNTFRCCMAPPV